MATEFDNSLHWGFFLTGPTLTSETGKYVRVSDLVLSALRAAGVFSNMVDGIVAPATDKLWLDKNFDPAVLKEWDATGASWVPMTYGRLFGRAAVDKLTVTGGTGNAVVVSQPVGFQASRLYLMTPTADNSGATTINVSGVGTYPVKYGDGTDIGPNELKTGRQAVLFFTGTRFEAVFPLNGLTTAVIAAQASADAAAASALLSQKYAANPEDVEVEPGLYSSRHYLAKVVAYWILITNTLAGWIHGATGKTTPVDADEFGIADSAASWGLKKVTWVNIKATLASSFGAMINTLTAKVTLSGNDLIVIADSAASNASKKATLADLQKEVTKGRQTQFIPAVDFVPMLTNGASIGIRAISVSNIPLTTANFDTTVQEDVFVPWSAPKKWDMAAVTYEVLWTGASAGAGGVTFRISNRGFNDGGSLDGASLGGAVDVLDTYQGPNIVHRTPVSGNVNPVGSISAEGWSGFRLSRIVSDANDTLAQDAQVIGIRLFYNTSTGNDA